MPTPFPLQRLDNRDVPQIIALFERVNWLMHADYIRWVIAWSKGGAFGITYRNKLLATALAIPYGGKRGWISMVVTEPSFQRRGLGRRITETAIDSLQRRGVEEIMLDSSPMGLSLYEGMGFRALYPILTHRGIPAFEDDAPIAASIRPANADDLGTLVQLDGAAFGAERPAMLETLMKVPEHQAWIDEIDGEARGFLMVQKMHKIEVAFGPWVHHDAAGARRLFRHAAAQTANKPVRVNAPGANPSVTAIMNDADMPVMARNTRMIYGDVEPGGDVAQSYSSASLAAG